jgi:hypothetical protein
MSINNKIEREFEKTWVFYIHCRVKIKGVKTIAVGTSER